MSELSTIDAPSPLDLPSTIPELSFCGIRIHGLTKQSTLDLMRKWITESVSRQICFLNAHTFVEARKNPAFRQLTGSADLVLADGTSLVWSSRFLGCRLPERIAGPDLMESFCEEANVKAYRFFFFGCTPDVLEDLTRTVQHRWPHILIAGSFAPPIAETFSAPENERMIENINSAKPDVLWVGMSSPKQDFWIAQNLRRLKVPISIGVGAAFNFISGNVRRAPLWAQQRGLEWLWRLIQEPRRLWRRYLTCNAAFARLIMQEIYARHTLKLIASRTVSSSNLREKD